MQRAAVDFVQRERRWRPGPAGVDLRVDFAAGQLAAVAERIEHRAEIFRLQFDAERRAVITGFARPHAVRLHIDFARMGVDPIQAHAFGDRRGRDFGRAVIGLAETKIADVDAQRRNRRRIERVVACVVDHRRARRRFGRFGPVKALEVRVDRARARILSRHAEGAFDARAVEVYANRVRGDAEAHLGFAEVALPGDERRRAHVDALQHVVAAAGAVTAVAGETHPAGKIDLPRRAADHDAGLGQHAGRFAAEDHVRGERRGRRRQFAAQVENVAEARIDARADERQAEREPERQRAVRRLLQRHGQIDADAAQIGHQGQALAVVGFALVDVVAVDAELRAPVRLAGQIFRVVLERGRVGENVVDRQTRVDPALDGVTLVADVAADREREFRRLALERGREFVGGKSGAVETQRPRRLVEVQVVFGVGKVGVGELRFAVYLEILDRLHRRMQGEIDLALPAHIDALQRPGELRAERRRLDVAEQVAAGALRVGDDVERAFVEIGDVDAGFVYFCTLYTSAVDIAVQAGVEEADESVRVLDGRPFAEIAETQIGHLGRGLEAAGVVAERPVGEIAAEHRAAAGDLAGVERAIEPFDRVRAQHADRPEAMRCAHVAVGDQGRDVEEGLSARVEYFGRAAHLAAVASAGRGVLEMQRVGFDAPARIAAIRRDAAVEFVETQRLAEHFRQQQCERVVLRQVERHRILIAEQGAGQAVHARNLAEAVHGESVELRGDVEVLRVGVAQRRPRDHAVRVARVQPTTQIDRQRVDQHRRIADRADIEGADAAGVFRHVGGQCVPTQMQLRGLCRHALAHESEIDDVDAPAVFLAQPARAEGKAIDADMRQKIVLVVERDRGVRGQHEIGEIHLGAHFAHLAAFESRPHLQFAAAAVDDEPLQRIVAQHRGEIDVGAAEVSTAVAAAAVVFDDGVHRRGVVLEILHAAKRAQPVTLDDQAQFVGAEFEMLVVRQIVDVELRRAHDHGAEAEQRAVVEALLIAAVVRTGVEAADSPLPLHVADEIELDAGEADFGPARRRPCPGEEVDLQSRAGEAERRRRSLPRRRRRGADVHAGQVEQRPGAFPARVELVDRHRPMQHRAELVADDVGMARHPRQHDELGEAAQHRHQNGEDG